MPPPSRKALFTDEYNRVRKSSHSFCGHGFPSCEYGIPSRKSGSFSLSTIRRRLSGYSPLSAIFITSSMRIRLPSEKKRE